MSQLQTYLTLQTQKLAQSNTGFHTSANRIAAINEAILKIADNYEIPELIQRPQPTGTITFTNGIAPIPSNFLRMIKLWDTVQSTLEYTYLINDLFDQLSPSSDTKNWTIDFNSSSGIQEFYIAPSNLPSVTLNMRYVILPLVLVNPTDDSGFTYHWDYAVAYKSSAILLKNEHNPGADIMEGDSVAEIQKAFQALRKQGGVKQGERLRSRFEKYPLLYNPQV